MKNMKLRSLALVAFLSIGMVSCSDDDTTSGGPELKTAYVTEVTGPETGAVNAELSYTVTYTVDNNCGNFYSMQESTSGTTKTLEVKARYDGSNCNATPVNKSTTYKFKPTAAGAYSLKFKKSATEFVTKNVTVN